MAAPETGIERTELSDWWRMLPVLPWLPSDVTDPAAAAVTTFTVSVKVLQRGGGDRLSPPRPTVSEVKTKR